MAETRRQDRSWPAEPIRRMRRTPLYGPLAWLFGRRAVVANASMHPLLVPGERVLFDRLAYRAWPPERGDVALLELLGREPRPMVKLVVGLPGERVSVAADQLWIDGRSLPFPQPVVGSMPGEWQLGPTEYFVLSYAAAVGTDSRHFGPLPRGALAGRAWLVYWPPDRRRRIERLRLELAARPP